MLKQLSTGSCYYSCLRNLMFKKLARLMVLLLSLLYAVSLVHAQKKTPHKTKKLADQSDQSASTSGNSVTKDKNTHKTTHSKEVDSLTILQKVTKFYQDTQDFKADFIQTFSYKIYGKKKISSGKVYFKKKSKMLWHYEVPVQRLFISDGSILWVYEPEEAQVFKRSLKSAQLPVALRFLKGDANLDKEFDIAPLVHNKDNDYQITLTPKKPSGDYRSLELIIDPKKLTVIASVIIDPVGNRNHIEFIDMTYNIGLKDDAFKFTVPKGVKIIEP